MFQGDEVAGVAADTEERAIDAARLIKVEYEVLPHVIASSSRRCAGKAPAVFDPGNVRARPTQETAISRPASRRRRTSSRRPTRRRSSRTPASRRTAAVCEWDGDKLTAWVSTQGVHGAREGFATALKIPQANVRVITEYMGGGFGSKFGVDARA